MNNIWCVIGMLVAFNKVILGIYHHEFPGFLAFIGTESVLLISFVLRRKKTHKYAGKNSEARIENISGLSKGREWLHE
jgi:hypothetical protein